MPAIRKGYRRIGGGALPRRILWAAGGMGVTVVANVLQKDGAHGAPYPKNNRLRMFAGRVRRAHQGDFADLVAGLILAGFPRAAGGTGMTVTAKVQQKGPPTRVLGA